MYCKNCGKELNDGAVVCLNCGVGTNTGNTFCPNCGSEHHPQAIVCVKCGVSLKKVKASNSSNSSDDVIESFGDAIKVCFSKYADFEGRANRAEYWYWFLFTFLFSLIPIVNIIAGLAFFIPSLAAAVRRLHDIGKSGWWYLIALIPIVGAIWLIVLLCQPSQPEANEYGECL